MDQRSPPPRHPTDTVLCAPWALQGVDFVGITNETREVVTVLPSPSLPCPHGAAATLRTRRRLVERHTGMRARAQGNLAQAEVRSVAEAWRHAEETKEMYLHGKRGLLILYCSIPEPHMLVSWRVVTL